MNWDEVRFNELYAVPSRNGVYKSKEFHGAGYKIVNMGELFGFAFISNQEMQRVQLTESEFERNCLLDGDLLFGRRSLVEAGAGKCSLVVNPSEPLTFESSIIRVRLDKERVEPRFYFYYFASPQGRGRISSIVTGTNVKGIRGSDLQVLKVAKPLLATQRKIAAILSTYDDLIENNLKRIGLLEEAVGQFYKEWFVRLRFPGHEHTRIVDGVPEGWIRKKLREFAEITMGQSPKSKYYNDEGEGLPFHQGVSDFGERFVTHRKYTTASGRIAQAGDILCSVRAPVGRLNITLDKIVIGRGLSAIRSRTGNQSLLYYQLKNYFFKEDMIGAGAIFASVTKSDMEKQELLIPTDSLIHTFEEISKPTDEQIRVLSLQNRKLEQARDLLLPRLMGGEIPV